MNGDREMKHRWPLLLIPAGLVSSFIVLFLIGGIVIATDTNASQSAVETKVPVATAIDNQTTSINPKKGKSIMKTTLTTLTVAALALAGSNLSAEPIQPMHYDSGRLLQGYHDKLQRDLTQNVRSLWINGTIERNQAVDGISLQDVGWNSNTADQG